MIRAAAPRLKLATRLFAALALILVLAGCGGQTVVSDGTASTGVAGSGSGAVTVDILYLNHSPVRPVLSEVDPVLAKYGDKLKVTRYDAETPQGEDFAKSHKITEHTPVAIFINGSMEVKVNGRVVKFDSFPKGQGTGMVPDGTWTVEDLDAALAQATGTSA